VHFTSRGSDNNELLERLSVIEMEERESITFGKDIKSDDERLHDMVEWELNRRRGRSATYTLPLIVEANNAAAAIPATSFEEQEDITSFLTEFYGYRIFDSMVDMKHLLQQHTDTVKVHYGLLVPNVCSFDEFWSRYYYRCSYTQVKNEILRKLKCAGGSIYESEEVDSMEKLKLEETMPQTVVSNSSSSPTTSQRRTQLFHQEYDRDIIEIIPEEADDDDNHPTTTEDDQQFETVGLGD
jgi:hypothetical protein